MAAAIKRLVAMILENAPGDSENFIYPPRRTGLAGRVEDTAFARNEMANRAKYLS